MRFGRPFRGAIGMLARSNALSGLRRTNSTAAPIVITVGLAASALVSTATLSQAEQQAARDRIATPVMVAAAGTPGLADLAIAALSEVPGVRVAVPTRQSVVYIDTGNAGDYEFPATYVAAGIDSVLRLPTREGSIADLRGTDTIAVSQSMAKAQNWRLGGTAQLWLVDSAQVRLRLVAILPDSADLGRMLLLPWELQHAHESRGGADMVYLALDVGASADVVTSAVEKIAAPASGRVVRAAEYLAERNNEENRINCIGRISGSLQEHKKGTGLIRTKPKSESSADPPIDGQHANSIHELSQSVSLRFLSGQKPPRDWPLTLPDSACVVPASLPRRSAAAPGVSWRR
jgi:putative ABC transport system permease protein